MNMKQVDKPRARQAIAEFLQALGLWDETLKDTPARVTDAFVDELLAGHHINLADLIQSGSEAVRGPSDPVLIENLNVATVCPHHLLVAQGKALVAYVPGSRLLGLGTVAQLVDACSRRLVFQEQIAHQVTGALMQHLGAQGAFCRIQLSHACLGARGSHQAEAMVTTWSAVGKLSDPALLETVLGRFLVGPGQDEAVLPHDDDDDGVSQVHNLPPEGGPLTS
jgi:GTP cyclohydrolase I